MHFPGFLRNYLTKIRICSPFDVISAQRIAQRVQLIHNLVQEDIDRLVSLSMLSSSNINCGLNGRE